MGALKEQLSNLSGLVSHSKEKHAFKGRFPPLLIKAPYLLLLLDLTGTLQKEAHTLTPRDPVCQRSGLVCSKYSCTVFASLCRERYSRYNSRLKPAATSFQSVSGFPFSEDLPRPFVTTPILKIWKCNIKFNITFMTFQTKVLTFPRLTHKVLWGQSMCVLQFQPSGSLRTTTKVVSSWVI